MGEETHQFDGETRDRQAARRDVDAGVRDRMADEDMPETERDARVHAARDRLAAMQDRQAAARERADADADADADGRRSSETTDDA